MTNAETMTPPTPIQVGWSFVSTYYKAKNSEDSLLHRFYSKDSIAQHGCEGDPIDYYVGQEEIHKNLINGCLYKGSSVRIFNVDSQPSCCDGIIVQVIGEFETELENPVKFVQTFFLGVQSRGYYVKNDILRILVDEFVEDGRESEVNTEINTCNMVGNNPVPPSKNNNKNNNESMSNLMFCNKNTAGSLSSKQVLPTQKPVNNNVPTKQVINNVIKQNLASMKNNNNYYPENQQNSTSCKDYASVEESNRQFKFNESLNQDYQNIHQDHDEQKKQFHVNVENNKQWQNSQNSALNGGQLNMQNRQQQQLPHLPDYQNNVHQLQNQHGTNSYNQYAQHFNNRPYQHQQQHSNKKNQNRLQSQNTSAGNNRICLKGIVLEQPEGNGGIQQMRQNNGSITSSVVEINKNIPESANVSESETILTQVKSNNNENQKVTATHNQHEVVAVPVLPKSEKETTFVEKKKTLATMLNSGVASSSVNEKAQLLPIEVKPSVKTNIKTEIKIQEYPIPHQQTKNISTRMIQKTNNPNRNYNSENNSSIFIKILSKKAVETKDSDIIQAFPQSNFTGVEISRNAIGAVVYLKTADEAKALIGKRAVLMEDNTIALFDEGENFNGEVLFLVEPRRPKPMTARTNLGPRNYSAKQSLDSEMKNENQKNIVNTGVRGDRQPARNPRTTQFQQNTSQG